MAPAHDLRHAHSENQDGFGPREGGGILFHATKAKGELKFDELSWTQKEVEERIKKMNLCNTELKEICDELMRKPVPGGLFGALGRAQQGGLQSPQGYLTNLPPIDPSFLEPNALFLPQGDPLKLPNWAKGLEKSVAPPPPQPKVRKAPAKRAPRKKKD